MVYPVICRKTYADWVIEQQLPVILVVGVKLGCINHALLTMESIEAAGLPVAGWVANEVEPAGIFQEQYLSTLNRMIKAPCLGVIHTKTLNGKLGSYLDLSLLTI